MYEMAEDAAAAGEQPVVMVAKPECLECTHLCGDLGSTEHDCMSDSMCPARFYRISLGVPLHKYAKRLANALSTGDASESAEIMAELSGLDPAVSGRIMRVSGMLVREQDT